jgi:DNA primase
VPRIKDESVEAVKQAADLVALVESRARLRKSGARYVGLCPFHQEKTPSFYVMPDRGFYICFGCHESGDAITFVEKTESVDFVGAIEFLADRFSIPLEYEEISPELDARRRRKERLLELLEAATAFYERYLWESQAGSQARDYLAGRGLTEAAAREFRLGLALGGSTLARKALAKGFTRDELLESGLANRRGNDYFQGRLLFPLADARGRVLGFQARKLREDDPLRAKYVNSPESELFKKGDLLYGLHLGRAAIAKADRALVVEGNTDVIALRQAGLEPVVASMGTALTERQLRELRRLTTRIWLCFDGDAAGEAATLRGMELALAQGLDVHVVALPPGVDPADLGGDFEQHLRRAEPYASYRVKLEIERADDRHAAYLRVQAILNALPEGPERQDAWRLANDRLGMTVQLRAAVSSTTTTAFGVSPKLLDAGLRLERDALAGVRAFPSLLTHLRNLGRHHFYDAQNRRVAEAMIAGSPPDKDLAPVLLELDVRAEIEGITEPVARQLLLRLREREVSRELGSADPARTKALQEALQEIREEVEKLSLQSAGFPR